jgi:Polyphosphate kinase
MMHRNLDRRIEVLLRIIDPRHVSRVLEHMNPGHERRRVLVAPTTLRRVVAICDG